MYLQFTERWSSGLRRTPGKRVGGQLPPGFESLSLRHYGRARWGGSGALYPQSAIAGLSACSRV